MSNTLTISLLGTVQIRLNQRQITSNFGTDTSRASLVYLALNVGTTISRDVLASLLWPEKSEKRAQGNLRQTINRVRIALDDRTSDIPFLLIREGTGIQFNPESDYTLDVNQFTALAETVMTHRHRRLEGCPICMARLEEAAAIYQGEMMAGFTLPSEPFQIWLRQEREYLHLQVMNLLYVLTNYHERLGNYAQAQKYAYQQIEFERWNEEAYQQLIRTLVADGQRSAALHQYKQCCAILKSEFDAPPTAETLALYESIRTNTFQKEPQQVVPFYNLPQTETPFIGRMQDVLQVTERLVDPLYRFVTITGAGGMGKTRLSLAVLEKVAVCFKDGITFVPLGELSVQTSQEPFVQGLSISEDFQHIDSDGRGANHSTHIEHLHIQLSSAITQAMGLTFRNGSSLKRQLFHHLQDKEMLFILDSFEHLMAGVGFIQELIQKAPKLILLITSRQPLNFAMESIYRLQGLAVPQTLPQALPIEVVHDEGKSNLLDSTELESDKLFFQEMLLTYEGVQLFFERIKHRGMAHVVNRKTWPFVVQICQSVAGMPLGIQLAAAQVGRIPLPVIAQKIADGLLHLETSMPDITDRHRSMVSVLQHSWQLLTKEESFVLNQASVFRKSFTQTAALEILECVTPDILANLIDKSLFWWAADERYEIHDLVRQFANQQLWIDRGTAQQVSYRHSDYYLSFVAAREIALKQGLSLDPFHELQRELDNIRQAWQWAITHNEWTLVEKSLKGMWRFYRVLGLLQEGEQIFEKAIESLQTQEDLTTTQKDIVSMLYTHRSFFLEQVSELVMSCQTASEAVHWAQTEERRAKSHLCYGMVLARLGEFDLANESLTYSLKSAKKMGSEENFAHALHTRGIVRLHQGRYDIAKQDYEKLLPIIRQIGDKRGELTTLCNLGIILDKQMDFGMAQAHYEQALVMAQVLNDQWCICNLYTQLGHLFFHLGNYTKSQSRYKQALSIAQKIQTQQLIGTILTYQSLLHHHLKEDDVAIEMNAKGLQIGRECNEPFIQGDAYTYLGHIFLALGRIDESIIAYEQSLGIRQEMNQLHLMMDSFAGLANAANVQGDIQLALHYVDKILTYLEQTPTFHSVEEPIRVLLTCYQILKAGNQPCADNILRKAYKLLLFWSSRIENIETRDRFLESVSAHQELMNIWKEQKKESQGFLKEP